MRAGHIGVEEGDDYLNLKIDGEGLSDKYVHDQSRYWARCCAWRRAGT